MNTITKVHVFSIIPKLREALITRCPGIVFKFVDYESDISQKYSKKVTEREVSQCVDAQILLADGNLFAQMHEKLSDLRWMQCTWAGMDSITPAFKNVTKPSYPMTRMSSHNFNQLLAEYAIGMIISHERDWIGACDYQRKSEWAHHGKIATYRSFTDLTIGVMGVGEIGREVIKSLQFFRSKIYGLGRSKQLKHDIKLDKYFSDITSFVADVDYIINTLPATVHTDNILTAEVLQHTRHSPVFMNIGRSNIISESTLLMALDQNWISTAILDVFKEEPLPSDNQLWKHPKVFITPHAAGVSRAEDIADMFAKNLEKFAEGEKLDYIFDWEQGY